jgi:hypothetical protein
VAVLCLALAGIVLHAVGQHGDDKAVHLQPLPSESDPSSSGSASPTPSDLAVATPKPQSVKVGPAICGPGDYRLTRVVKPDPETGTRTGTSYQVIATYAGPVNSHCIFTEYPKVTVLGIAGKRRTLNPAGGFVDGYGQPPPTSLSEGNQAVTFLLIEKVPTKGNACNKKTPVFRDVKLADVPLVPTLAVWCTMAESPWQPVGKTLTDSSGSGAPSCKPYNLKLVRAPAPVRVGKHVTYTFTVRHKNGADCQLDDFPHLAATVAATSSIHQLKLIHHPEGPAIKLTDTSALATARVVINTGRCARPGQPLKQLRIENLYYALKPIDVPRWCSITESYWLSAS